MLISVFVAEKLNTFLYLLAYAVGRFAIFGTERLVVAISAPAHPYITITVGTGEACINRNFLNTFGKFLFQHLIVIQVSFGHGNINLPICQ